MAAYHIIDLCINFNHFQQSTVFATNGIPFCTHKDFYFLFKNKNKSIIVHGEIKVNYALCNDAVV